MDVTVLNDRRHDGFGIPREELCAFKSSENELPKSGTHKRKFGENALKLRRGQCHQVCLEKLRNYVIIRGHQKKLQCLEDRETQIIEDQKGPRGLFPTRLVATVDKFQVDMLLIHRIRAPILCRRINCEGEKFLFRPCYKTNVHRFLKGGKGSFGNLRD